MGHATLCPYHILIYLFSYQKLQCVKTCLIVLNWNDCNSELLLSIQLRSSQKCPSKIFVKFTSIGATAGLSCDIGEALSPLAFLEILDRLFPFVIRPKIRNGSVRWSVDCCVERAEPVAVILVI